MVMIGVESGDQKILDKYKKNISLKDVEKAISICGKNHIYTMVYFILGLPGEDETSLQNTIKFIRNLPCDFISISFAMPDIGTELREISLKYGLCEDELGGWDHSLPFLRSRYSHFELLRTRNRAYRNFYLRPSWILKKIKDFRYIRFSDFKMGLGVLKEWL